MNYRLVFFTLLLGQSLLFSQVSNSNLPVFTTSGRDSLSNVQEGYTLFNKSTGCINYFFNSNWMEICGKCTPDPKPIQIDSICFENGVSSIYFSPVIEGCSYSFSNNIDNIIITAQSSPAKTLDLKQGLIYKFKQKINSSCGEYLSSDWSKEFNINPIDYCKGKTEYVDHKTGITYHLFSYGKSCWMRENFLIEQSLITNSKQVKLLEGEMYYTWEYALNNKMITDSTQLIQGVCPQGFHLPNWVEITSLRYSAKQNPSYLFNITPAGAYDFKNKKLDSRNFLFFWTSIYKSFILSVNNQPELMRSESNIGLPVKCVMD